MDIVKTKKELAAELASVYKEIEQREAMLGPHNIYVVFENSFTEHSFKVHETFLSQEQRKTIINASIVVAKETAIQILKQITEAK